MILNYLSFYLYVAKMSLRYFIKVHYPYTHNPYTFLMFLSQMEALVGYLIATIIT